MQTALTVAPDLELEVPGCDLCGNLEQRPLFAVKDRRHHKPGEFELVECTRCALRYVSPRPVASTISRWYPTTYKAHHKKRFPRLAKLADALEDRIWNAYLRLFLTRSYPIFYYPKFIARFAADRAPRLLDVGCGSGDKLRYVNSHSAWETFGVDMNPQAVENANARGAGDVRLATGDELPFDDGFFDAAMSWHSLEHHYSPRRTMAEVARVLRPGGYGIFAIPSGDNLGIRMFRSYWGPLEVPRHLYYFTTETITRLCASAGLAVHRIYYDFSFYGLFFEEEILESMQNLARDRGGFLRVPLQLPFQILRTGGLLSSAATLPILPFNRLLGRLWRGTNLIVHFTKLE